MKTNELDQIGDVEILEEAPKKVKIGSRFVLIRQLTVREYFWIIKAVMRLYLKHSDELIKIFNIYKEAKAEESSLKQTANYAITLIKIDSFRRELFGILNKVFPVVGRRLPFQASYLERHATPNDILQIVFGLYQYNISDVKKNAELLAESMKVREMLVSSNLKKPSSGSFTGQRERSSEPQSEKSCDTAKKEVEKEINL